jgi:hypothetical protein
LLGFIKIIARQGSLGIEVDRINTFQPNLTFQLLDLLSD